MAIHDLEIRTYVYSTPKDLGEFLYVGICQASTTCHPMVSNSEVGIREKMRAHAESHGGKVIGESMGLPSFDQPVADLSEIIRRMEEAFPSTPFSVMGKEDESKN